MLSKNQLKLVRSLELKKNRKKEGLFVAEGPKVVGDLLRADYRARLVFSTTERPDAILISDDELRKLSFLQHPQEVLAVFEIPMSPKFFDHGQSVALRIGDDRGLNNGSPSSDLKSLRLALDGIQDPGNLGTIIRIADWFGIDTIYCSEDTADVYNPKVVQATMGSLAHIHIVYCDLVELLQQYDGPIYGTLLDGNDIYQQELSQQGIIVMGNEGNGISQRVRPLITHKLLIPNFNKNSETAESLNVAIATAITCSEFRRR